MAIWKVRVDSRPFRKAIEKEDNKKIIEEVREICEKVITYPNLLKKRDGCFVKSAFEDFLDNDVEHFEFCLERDIVISERLIEAFLETFYDLCDEQRVFLFF